jgi:hypothetical protein
VKIAAVIAVCKRTVQRWFKATMEPRMVSKRCIDEAKSYVEREDFPKVKRRRLRRSSSRENKTSTIRVLGLKT